MSEVAIPGPDDPLPIERRSGAFEALFPGADPTLFVVRFCVGDDCHLLAFKHKEGGLMLPFWRRDESTMVDITLAASLKEFVGADVEWAFELDLLQATIEPSMTIISMMGHGAELPNLDGPGPIDGVWLPAHEHQAQINSLLND